MKSIELEVIDTVGVDVNRGEFRSSYWDDAGTFLNWRENRFLPPANVIAIAYHNAFLRQDESKRGFRNIHFWHKQDTCKGVRYVRYSGFSYNNGKSICIFAHSMNEEPGGVRWQNISKSNYPCWVGT